jgi:hypothetical protein
MPISFPDVWGCIGSVVDADFERNRLPHPPSNVVCDIFRETGLDSPFDPLVIVTLPSIFRSKFC